MLKARSENRVKNAGVYYEAHHIIPRCLGGEGDTKQWKTHPNIILLTANEHRVAHRLLCEIYPDNYKLLYALNAMYDLKYSSERNYRISSREYEIIKNKLANIQTNIYKGENNPNYGNKWDYEKKVRASNRVKGENNPMYGKKRLDHSKKMKGENNPSSKLTLIDAEEIRNKYISGIYTQKMLAEEYGVHRSTIMKIIQRKRFV
jgi:hypothetical protein